MIGRDPVMLVYPNVNSCITLTYYFDPDDSNEEDEIGWLTGAHFAMYDEKDPTDDPLKRLSTMGIAPMLKQLDALAPRGKRPRYGFLIGANSSWVDDNPETLDEILKHAKNTLGRSLSEREYVGFPQQWEKAEIQIITRGGCIDASRR